MNAHRRRTDNCIAKRLWERGTPYIQSGGFFTILGILLTIAWTAISFINNTQAALPQVQQNTTDIQLMKQNMASMKQEIDDIYAVVVKRK